MKPRDISDLICCAADIVEWLETLPPKGEHIELRNRMREILMRDLPRDVAGEAVETPALDELFERVRVTGSRKALGDDLVSRARLELSRLKARPKVSVEEARATFWAAFNVPAHDAAEANDNGLRAVLALV